MFKNLFDFGFKRNAKGAFGFYVAYLILTVVASALLGALIGLLFGTENFNVALRIGTTFSVAVVLTLSFLILAKKKLIGHLGYLLLALSSGVLAYFGGGLLGLIPVSFLTTRTSP
ncbi:MAG: hypothetical protein ABH845_01410 [Candidatus Omnitrophota bacterium]